MKKRLLPKALALIISLLFALETAAVGTHAYMVDNTPTEQEAIMQTPDGFDNYNFGALATDNKLTLNDKDLVEFEPDEYYGGVVISGKVSKIEQLRIELNDELDFKDMKVARFVMDAVTQRKARASLCLFIDGAAEPALTIALPRQNKKGNWTVQKSLCADLSALKLTGKHKVAFSIKYADSVSAGTSASLLLRSFFFTAQTVPVMEVNIDESEGTISEMNNDEEHLTECYGSVSLTVPEGYKSEYSDKTYTSGKYELEYIRGRGNSTWMADKRPYKLKFEKKQDFFGMGANKHWVLLANYYDFTMLRNKYTYWLGAEMGMEFTPQCVFIDLVMNGQYLGSYYLCEQIRVGKSRVNIDDLEDSPELSEGEGITGGYLLSLGGEEGDYRMVTTANNNFLIENPDFTDYVNEAQYNYISDYLRATDEAIYAKDFKNLEGKHYSEYLDVDAAIDYYLVQEFSLNGDAFGSGSTYLYKKRGGKLFWGPLWDFDYVAWGATEYTHNEVEGFYSNNTAWFSRLLTDPEFVSKLKARWKQIKPIFEKSSSDGDIIDKYARELYMSQKANYYVCGTEYSGSSYDDYYGMGGYNAYNNVDNYNKGSDGEQQDEEVHVVFDTEVQRLKRWIRERIDWFDENIDSIVPKRYKATFKVDGKVYSKAEFFEEDFGANIPEPPSKKGYSFLGWYTKNEYGEEVNLNDFYFGDNDSVTFKAKWRKKSPKSDIKKIAFPYKDIYVTGNYMMSGQEDYDSYDLPLSVMPFNKSVALNWTCSDYDIASVDEDGRFTPFVSEGEVKVTASAGELKATCTVHIGDYIEEYGTPKLKKKKITLTQGEYSQVRLKTAPKSYWSLTGLVFASADESVAKVDSNGFVYGKKAGKTVVIAESPYIEGLLLCNVTVKAAPLKKGSNFAAGALKYKVTKLGKTGTVTVTGAKSKTAKLVKIPAAVKKQGKTFKVTAVAAGAFKNMKKLGKVTIASKTIKKIGKGAFAGTPKNLTFKFPAALKKKYAKMVKKSK